MAPRDKLISALSIALEALQKERQRSGRDFSMLTVRAIEEVEQVFRQEHDLYDDDDEDRPGVICDSNGQVTLGLCKRCGKAEAELYGSSCKE